MAEKKILRNNDEVHYAKWLAYVEQYKKIYNHGKGFPVSSHAKNRDRQTLPINYKRHEVIICSPHPDDEALTGALALRLKTSNLRVLNLAITLGSNPSRKNNRKAELAASCRVLGFDCRLVRNPLAFPDIINVRERKISQEWHERRNIIVKHFAREQPELVLFPHADDGHPTHIFTHYLILEALKLYCRKQKRKVLAIETGFWQPIKNPNLLLGLSTQEVAKLITALTCHHGEIARNPYHLMLPAYFMDKAVRVAELSKFGDKGTQIQFAEIYKLSRIEEQGRQIHKKGEMIHIPPEKKLTLSELNSL